MLGSLLAGCEEGPGEMVFIHGKQFKLYRGWARWAPCAIPSAAGPTPRTGISRMTCCARTNSSRRASRARCPTAGRSAAVADQLVGGLRAAMGYCGARNIAELQQARFTQITAAGLAESHPHDIEMTAEAPNYARRRP